VGQDNLTAKWEPIQVTDRYTTLDLLRGLALFAVLLVNLLDFFRLSLFDHILRFHSHPGWANHAVDVLVAGVLEFKAFDLFSLTFGIGVAVQAERAVLRCVGVELFLLRRFLILLAFGACHLVLISNVDILTLYAVCGLLMIPLLRLPSALLALAGLAAIYLPPVFPRGPAFPPMPVLQAHAAAATRIYSQGSFSEILSFRWHETHDLLAPLLIGSAQKTLGLMLLGVALWRFGIIKDPQRHRLLLWTVCLGAGAIGAINTAASVLSESSGKSLHVPRMLHALGSHVLLAFAYAAGLLLWRRSQSSVAFTAPLAAAGRMALSNYLVQSFVLALLFYGYGFGLFGRLAPTPAAAIGVAFYLAQLAFSAWWLHRYRFGPFEWLWRSMTYGRRQPMRLKV
jgi:uncharacterized protein